jgi:putative hemolysin
MNVGFEIFIIFLFIVLNGVFVMSEMAIASSRKARLQQRSNEGNKGAAKALKLNQDPNMFLATVQIGITLISVLIGAVGATTFADPLGKLLARIPVLSPYAESVSLALVVVTITTVSIVIGELLPKRLALHSPERVASMLAGPMNFLSRLFTPLVWLFARITDGLMQLIGVKPGTEPPVTEEEIQLLIDQGTQAGVFEEAEHDMVEGVFSLGDQRVYSLMTPRTDIVYLDVNDSMDEIREKIAHSEFSRFPVRQGTLDVILGIVKARDLLVRSLSGEQIRLKDLVKPAFFIPETTFASRALEIFKEKSTELLLVIDEFGGLQGMLTLTDVLEEIVGQIEAEEPQATQRQDGSWLLDGMLEVDEFKEIFNLQGLPHEDEYETLSGFVMMTLGRVPQQSDQFEWHGLRFEVIDMDGRRVDKVLVTTLPHRPVTAEPSGS